jgi:tetratricopeptide (TPR) repeat protein
VAAVFDNVDRAYGRHDSDPDAYDIASYLSGADHGSVLVTTRLASFEHLGVSRRLNKVDKDQAQAIFQNWYKRSYGEAQQTVLKGIRTNILTADPVQIEELFSLLDGLPLAIAQAAAYLQESGINLTKYISFYNQQWKELMESQHQAGIPLRDYPDRSVWTTWTISYNAIQAKNKPAANMLLLWAWLDNKDLWYGLLTAAWKQSTVAAKSLPEWFREIASSELKFIEAVKLLRNYSLIEDVEDLESYTTHPVVHKWALSFQDTDQRVELAQLAVIVVGLAVPRKSTKGYSSVQRRLLPHAHLCSQWAVTGVIHLSDGRYDMAHPRSSHRGDMEVLLNAIHGLGMLYVDQGKLAEAEEMYQRALQGKEKALGPEHTSTLETVNHFGSLYRVQDKLAEAEEIYQRALQGREKILGPEHISTLDSVHNLGCLYRDQGKLAKAEEMYQRALLGTEKALGPEHTSTLKTVHNLGLLYVDQGKLAKAEKMYQRALQGMEKALGPEHTLTLDGSTT